MVRNVKSLTKKSTHYELQELLSSTPKLHAYPVVDNPCMLLETFENDRITSIYFSQALRMEAK